jgi:tetratricopeptide (TPR) repeat protein
MKFNRRLLGYLLVCALLGGCATSAPKNSKSKTTTATEAEIAAPGASVLPVGPATPNPYLQHRPSVSAQVTQTFNAATQAMRNKQWAQAQSLLQKIIAVDPKLSGAHLNLALVYSAQGDLTAAEKSFNAALQANPDNLDAYNQLAILKREAGDFPAAEKLYLTALQHWGFHPASHKNIAILYDLYLNKPEQALPHYEAYLQLVGGEDKQVISWIADLQRRLGIVAKTKPTAPATESHSAEATDDEIGEESEVTDE